MTSFVTKAIGYITIVILTFILLKEVALVVFGLLILASMISNSITLMLVLKSNKDNHNNRNNEKN